MTWYITITSDDKHSLSIETTSLVTFLSSIPVLQQTSPVTFGNAIGSPWVDIILAKCNDRGGYSSYHEYIPTIDIVELVCSAYEHREWYENIATQIAEFLGWEAWEEGEERQICARSSK
ncbi:hypothetical protein [Chamaesiphon minutus]|uniref:Uncharacterized protein n=1 Tax=Chamaesiphon minutus (strain ATCC 27169 / PCC 6605) TaxID=1173020 RepID=K9UCD7_CHAP6|nr:hypothetical protein [Chamaesiphon minutus]AFY92278.1 hypothetical protein Cha6605_1043 [Chamaesiphon minutus PCC 6605]